MTKKLFILMLILFPALAISCNSGNEGKDNHSNASVKAFKADNGWGYSIYINGKEFVRQAYIPAVEGMAHFSSEHQALGAGNLVLAKVRRHQSPSLKKEELIRLGIVDSSMAIISE